MNTFEQLTTAEKLYTFLNWFPDIKTMLLEAFKATEDTVTAEDLNREYKIALMHKANRIASKNSTALKDNNAIFAGTFTTGDLEDLTIGLIRSYAQQEVSKERPKLREAVQLLFTADTEQLHTLPLSEYKLFDKVQLLFNLFPQHLHPFVDYLQAQASAQLASPLLHILVHHKEKLCRNSYAFARLLTSGTRNSALDQMRAFIAEKIICYAEQTEEKEPRLYSAVSSLFFEII